MTITKSGLVLKDRHGVYCLVHGHVLRPERIKGVSVRGATTPSVIGAGTSVNLGRIAASGRCRVTADGRLEIWYDHGAWHDQETGARPSNECWRPG